MQHFPALDPPAAVLDQQIIPRQVTRAGGDELKTQPGRKLSVGLCGSLCRCSSCPASSVRRVVAKIRDNLWPFAPFSLPAVGVETVVDAVLFALSRATHKELD